MPCLNGISGIGGGNGIWFGLLSNITTLIFWGGIIIAAVFLFKSLSSNIRTSTSRRPLDILKERFAKGEISEADFERMKSQL